MSEALVVGSALLVDDNAVQAGFRREILVRSGLSVAVAASGREALDRLAHPAFRASLGLLITDHLMPGMGGPELVRAVLAAVPGLPVLVLSGLAEAEREYEGLPVLFRVKPCPPGELIRLARHMIEGQSRLSA